MRGFASLASPAAFLDLPTPRVPHANEHVAAQQQSLGNGTGAKKKAAGELMDDLQNHQNVMVMCCYLPAGGVSVSSSAPIDTNITAASHAHRTKLLEWLEQLRQDNGQSRPP